MDAGLYETDFYEWTVANATLLRSGLALEADLENIAEELEAMGRRERRELLSRPGILIGHLLKWQTQPERQSKSWEATSRLQRQDIRRLLGEMPSLRIFLKSSLGEAHELAVTLAAAEIHLHEDVFPSTCPFAFEALLDDKYLP